MDQPEHQTAAINFTKPIRCIVKLGVSNLLVDQYSSLHKCTGLNKNCGAAITCKNELEKINEETLKTVSVQLQQAMMTGSSSGKVLGMDWSKRPGISEILCGDEDFRDQPVSDSHSFIVVHGAGSFGHFQASRSGVHKGGLDQPLVKAGFVATRISVTYLNLEVVRALAREGIPSIGMSPFSCGWSTCQRNIEAADLSMVASAINTGFIPVLHGDAVLDSTLDCTILSGDVIIHHLAAQLKPEFVVFLTDVFGVYDRPPVEPNAVLLKEIAVHEDGNWSVLNPTLEDMNRQVEMTVSSHDTTGGMATKISEAAMIAKLGIDVYIVKAGTNHSLKALSGEIRGNLPADWLGTVIRFVR